ncbi:hypothetical protein V6N12_002929 [Hibiscus sabdariffa]|uniref:RNase H type-1 domain-containing protein n=1 Tax=Hibiscus sabdariffa TaxID=183260 RepID=A0ABR2EAE9_9ROSI
MVLLGEVLALPGLVDPKGIVLIRFSKSIGLSDPTGVELSAILEACILFQSSPWVERYKLVIESDSFVSVKWIANPCAAPANFFQIASKCSALCLESD